MEDRLLDRNKNINRGYRKLHVWGEAIEFYVFVQKKLDTLRNISFKVKAQIEDSALSVSSNIAEGYSRRSLRENINFNNYSLGSLSENYTQFYALLKAGKIENDWFDEYDKKHYSLENKLIALNKSQVKYLKEKGSWNDDYILREDEIIY